MVDDEPSLLDGFRIAFNRAGRPIVTSGSFEEARRKVLEDKFDILVTDVRLGAFNGLQLAIIARDRDPEIGIIVFSGYDDPVLQEEAARLGAHYLVKPVTFDRLLEAIESLKPRS
jgi:DNA-binding NtrC family response regulator